MFEIQKVSIIGMGLIGGSLALALKHAGLRVTGVDINSENINLALKLQAVDKATSNLQLGVAEADLVILATPVGRMLDISRLIEPILKNGCIITDVGSCKLQLVRPMEEIFGPSKYYVGGHPMAGSERSGMEAADRLLFENAAYVLTPTKNTHYEALCSLENLILKIGASLIKLAPEQHDLIVAAVSHLPHLVAVNLVNTIGALAQEEHMTLMLAAGGFRDTTRIAMGDAVMWKDICDYNKPQIKKMLASFKNKLSFLEQTIDEGNYEELIQIFHSAKNLRGQIPGRSKGLLPSLFELVVSVPDRPGMIAEVAGILANQSINIIDIEIIRVRETDGGTIRIGFRTLDEVHAAFGVLQKHGYPVRQR